MKATLMDIAIATHLGIDPPLMEDPPASKLIHVVGYGTDSQHATDSFTDHKAFLRYLADTKQRIRYEYRVRN